MESNIINTIINILSSLPLPFTEMYLFTHLSYELQPLYGLKGLEEAGIKLVLFSLVNSNEMLIDKLKLINLSGSVYHLSDNIHFYPVNIFTSYLHDISLNVLSPKVQLRDKNSINTGDKLISTQLHLIQKQERSGFFFYEGMTPVAKRMMSKTMMNTTTPIIIIILVFFHQYFLETCAEVL